MSKYLHHGELTLRKQDALALTDRLRELIELGPGNHPIVHGKAKRVLASLQDAGCGAEADGQCNELRGLLDRWFSAGPWARDPEGGTLQRDLHRQLAGLETCLDDWYSTDDRRSPHYDEQAD